MSARVVRLLVVAGVLVALVLIAHLSGLTHSFSTEKIRALIQSAGAWGVVLFVIAFAVGELLHLPGMMFVAAGVLVWGRVLGGVIGFAGAIASVSFSFAFVRTLGGQPFAEVHNPRLKRILARLERRPILTITLLRLVAWMAPTVNYVLALSGVRYRDYLIGSALGLIVPIGVFAALLGIFFH